MDIDSALARFVQERQIPIFGIASADGFEYALPGQSPKELMPRCRSVICVEPKKHIANDSWWEVNETVFREVAKWRGEIINLFDEFGLATANFGGYGPTSEPTFSYRLAQYEAGIGVYGRFGVCLNPDFGCYYKVGVLLTDAALIPSDKARLEKFSPCVECRICADICPVQAIDPSKAPTMGYNRDLCSRFILKMKERHGANAKICARCFSVCPWSWQKQGASSIA